MFKVIDFDMILLDYNVLILGVSQIGYQAKCFQLTTMSMIIPFLLTELEDRSLPIITSPKISCRPILTVSTEFECTLQASDYYVYNFHAKATFSQTTSGSITDVHFYSYSLPDVFSNGRCDSTLDFVICESDVRDFFNIPVLKIQGARRKVNIMSIYAKFNSET